MDPLKTKKSYNEIKDIMFIPIEKGDKGSSSPEKEDLNRTQIDLSNSEVAKEFKSPTVETKHKRVKSEVGTPN